MRALGHLLVVSAICCQLAGCVAPTLPTPPPVTTMISLVGSEAVVTGEIEPLSMVACVNEDTGRGAIETSDARGRFEVRIPAEEGHHLTLWQIVGSAPGQLLDLVVPAAGP